MNAIEQEIKIKTLEAEIKNLKILRLGLVEAKKRAEQAVIRNDERQEEKRREIIAILRANAEAHQ